MDPRERARLFTFNGAGALYRDHLGRRIIADVEGAGVFRASAPFPLEIEWDGRKADRNVGAFQDSLLVATRSEGTVRIEIQLAAPSTDPGPPPGVPSKAVQLPHTGAGWIVRCSAGPNVDSRNEPSPAATPPLALPFFRSVEGSGTVEIVPADENCELIDSFSIADAEALAARSFAAQNLSKLSSLQSTFADGTPLEAPVASHLNRASWRLSIPGPSSGLILRKTYDRFHGRQRARVFVDGAFAGWWYLPFEDRQSRWAVDDFGIPAEFVQGKDSVEIAIDPPAGTPLWSVSSMQTFSLTSSLPRGGGTVSAANRGEGDSGVRATAENGSRTI